MSFLSKPGKYLREALEARRERQRQRIREARAAHHHDHTRPQVDGDTQRSHHERPSNTTVNVQNSRRRKDDNMSQPVEVRSSISKMYDSIFGLHDFEDAENHEGSIGDPNLSYNSSILSVSNPNNADGDDNARELVEEKSKCQRISVIDLPFGHPEEIPSAPILSDSDKNCCGPFACHRYHVSERLHHNFPRQSLFLKRVMGLLTIELIVVLLWIIIVMFNPTLSKFMQENYNFSYIPLGIFFVSKVALRSIIKIRKLREPVLLVIAAIRTLCIAYYCAAVTVSSGYYIIALTIVHLLFSHFFFTLTSLFVDYDVSNPEIIGMAAVVNAVFSVYILIIFLTGKFELDFGNFFELTVLNWVPSFITSEIIMMVVMFDLKQIMSGWRFPLGESDWIYTVLYL